MTSCHVPCAGALFASGIVAASALVLLLAGGTHASAEGPGDPAPLNTLPVPSPPNEGDFVRDRTSAVKLGKALFWDMQAGSDGRTACATCHFDAGADNRSRNQVNPHGGAFTLEGPNGPLTAGDFPLHRLADADEPRLAVLADTNDVVGSQGVVASRFAGVTPGDPARPCAPSRPTRSSRSAARPSARRRARNTPSVINAVFNFRNFWDGRAQNDFNGVTRSARATRPRAWGRSTPPAESTARRCA